MKIYKVLTPKRWGAQYLAYTDGIVRMKDGVAFHLLFLPAHEWSGLVQVFQLSNLVESEIPPIYTKNFFKRHKPQEEING